MAYEVSIFRKESDCICNNTYEEAHNVEVDNTLCCLRKQISYESCDSDSCQDVVVRRHKLRETLDELRLCFAFITAGKILHNDLTLDDLICIRFQKV